MAIFRQSPLPNLDRSIVLVGLMGAGKTSVGRRLAQHLQLPFVDADSEIEAAAGCTVEDYFRDYGEEEFRKGERKVIARLLRAPVHVLATGGGAFMDPRTRAAIRERGISVWLRADLEVLLRRVCRRTDRPLLKHEDPRQVLSELMERRHPVYGEADLTVESGEGPHDAVVAEIVRRLGEHLQRPGQRSDEAAEAW